MNRVTVTATYDGQEYQAAKTYETSEQFETATSIVDQSRYIKATMMGTGAICAIIDRETDTIIHQMQVIKVLREFDIDQRSPVSPAYSMYEGTDDYEY
jgi:hypothetical protein